MKIHKQKQGEFTKADAQTLAAILLKAGYTVTMKYEPIPGSTTKSAVVEYFGDDGK